MKKILKSVSILLMLILLLIPVAGCGTDPGTATDLSDIDICCFCTDTYDIPVGENKDVKFTAHIESLISPETIELFENDVAISKMYDDGTKGDEHADDNVYTCVVSLSKKESGAFEYYAAYEDNKSIVLDISFYEDLTEEEVNAVIEVVESVNSIKTYDETLEFLKSSSDIKEYEENTNDKTISYKTVYGVTGVWGVDSSGNYKASGTNSVPVANGVDYETAKANAKKITSAPVFADPKISVFRPYRSSEFLYDDFKEAGELVADTFKGDAVIIDDGAADLEALKTFDDYDITLVDSHGCFTSDKPYICIGESFGFLSYMHNLEKGGFGDFISERIIILNDNRLAVGPGFVDKYYEDNSLNGSFIFLGICSGLKNDRLAQSLLNKGAVAVAGYNETVGVNYCNRTMFECVINSMLLSETTLSEGVDSAIEVYGPKSSVRNACRLEFRGNGDYCFYNHGGANTPSTQAQSSTAPVSGAVNVTDFTVEDEFVMNIGELCIIEPEFTPADADAFNISWTSSDNNVATVSPTGEAGIVSSHSLGTATITAELTSGSTTITRTTTIRVTPKARDTILILDVSGSMYGDALNEMKEAAVQFCNDLLKDDYNNRVGLVFFESDVVTYNLTDDLSYLVDVIENVDCGGVTNMHGGLEAADYMMDSLGREEAIKNVVIMADGVPNEGATSSSGSSEAGISVSGSIYSYYFPYTNAIVDLADEMMDDYNLYSLGFFHSMTGSEVTFVSDFMKQLTNMEDGYHQVDKAEDLQFAFGDITEEISSGSKIIINIACPVDVVVKHGTETLSSASADFNDSASFGKLQLLGKNKDKKVVTLDSDKVYDIELTGTGEGAMNYSVNYFDESEKIVDFRNFESVPISKTTIINSTTDNSVENVELEVDMDGDSVVDMIYSASANSTASITMDSRNNRDGLPVWAIVLIISGGILVSGGVVAIILVSTLTNKKNRREEVIFDGYNPPQPPSPPADFYEPPVDVYKESVITEDDERKYYDSKPGGAISVENGALGGFRVPVGEGQVVNVGSGGKYSHLVLAPGYPHVSRLHCTISYSEGMYYVVDCSSNGTYLNNGTRLQKGKRTAVKPQSVLILANKQCMIFLD